MNVQLGLETEGIETGGTSGRSTGSEGVDFKFLI